MFFTNRQNGASRLNKRNKKRREMSLYHYKREKEGRRNTRARESVLFEAISSDALNRIDEVFVISHHFTKDTSKLRTQKKKKP